MNDTAQVFGLPLHPLLVHAVVVLLPLGVLALVFAQFWPSARRAIGLASPVAALIVATLVPVTIAAGESLAAMTGSLPSVIEHERYGRMLLPWSTALFVTAVAQWAWFRWVKPRLQQATETLGHDNLGRAWRGGHHRCPRQRDRPHPHRSLRQPLSVGLCLALTGQRERRWALHTMEPLTQARVARWASRLASVRSMAAALREGKRSSRMNSRLGLLRASHSSVTHVPPSAGVMM